MSMDLAELTTLRVGGPARELLSPETPAELVRQTIDTWASGEPWLLLGGGSNLLVADEGFDGTVIRVLTRGIERNGDILRVQAGEPWDAVVAFAVENGLAGIEALSGIPGSTGAAPVQNIGAYGQELSEVLLGVEFVDFLTGEQRRIPAAELALDYRTSALKQGRRGLVLSIDLQLEPSGLSRPLAYAQLADTLGVAVGDRVPLVDVRAAVLRLRASKGMLLSPDDPDSVSAGSFFTNPIVNENFARALPSAAPRWILDPEAPESPVKLSAAWLIEHSGISRGFSLPGSRAAISTKHTLALVNTGGASAEEVAELARYVQLRVLSQFGVRLQPEPQLVDIQL
ncbi:MAG TPA: UDP-N-acetylmuramate dehydrogenase [Terrimesophilobacter sp.]|jgi:UDP-N-acetylenolpyruvoylglucosamine reductase